MTVGKPYLLSAAKLLRTRNEIESTEDIRKCKTFFCSELIATAYKKLGLLDNQKAASKYWPGDFADEQLELQEGASLSKEF